MSKIPSPLFEARKKYPDQPAVITDKRTVTFAEFDDYVRSAMERLKFGGIKENERVAIVLPNSFEYLVVLIALWRIKVTACLMSTRLPSESVLDTLNRINCVRVITRVDQPLRLKSSKIKLHNAFDIVQKINTEPVKLTPIQMSLPQETTILFTSGSTKEPKAVVHTFANHYYNALGANQHIPFGPGDRWLLSLPLYHAGGLGILFRALLGCGAIVIPPTDLRMIRVIKKFNITHVSLVPTQLYRMFYPPHNLTILAKLKAILLGGSAVPETLIARAQKARFPLYKTYGLTEMASQVTTSIKGNPQRQIVLPHRQLKIAEDGEILVKGETLFKSYLDGNKINQPLTKDGWFKTGDLGVIDENGLVVTGRKDNMFISGGENIYPEEIEKILCSLDGIEDALVIPVENKEFGFRPVAFLKINSRGQANPESFRKKLELEVPQFKIPDRFYRWPKDLDEENIKIDRRQFLNLIKKQKTAL